MLRPFRPCLILLLVAFGSLTLAGCGGKGATPKGRVVLNGQPYKFADGEEMSISFNSTAGAGAASVTVGSDGSFAVGGEGLVPGSYKVNLVSATVGPNVPANRKYQDKLKGKFSGPDTLLQVEIGAGSPTLVIDLGKKTATAS